MPSLRQIRVSTGVVLYVYVTLHFANHALGNISIGAMESGLAIQKLIWQSPPGALILYASLLTHMSLGFWALYERRRFRWTRLEATQLALGLSLLFWRGAKPLYLRVKGLLLSIAVLLPALALLGYYQGGERTLEAVKDPAWLARPMSPDHAGAPAQNAVLLD